MNFNNNTMLYPKKDELNPTKDDGVNPSFYPKEEGFNPFNGIVERINALESITQNYEDSFETKELTITENAQIENLNATEGTVNRLNSTNATVTNLNSTNATVINADVENAQIENINATEGTVDTLNSTTSTITNLNSTTSTVTNGNIKNAKVESLNATEGKINTLESTNATVTNLNSTNATVNTLNSTTSTVTNGNIKNAEVENLNATEGTVDTLESTTSTVTNGNIKNAKVESLNVTKNAEIKKLHATEGTVDTLNLTNCNIKNADIENLHTNKLTWDLPNIDVINAETIKLHATEGTVDTLNSTNGNIINAEVEKLDVTKEIKVENLKTEKPILSNAVVGYDENGKMIPIKIAELEEKVDKDLANATGTLPVANGGTGATDAKNGFMNLANGLSEDNGPLDTEYVIYKNTSGNHYGLYTLSTFWNYIKGKISSVLGLTATQYNGNANTANKIEPNYTTNVELSEVTSETTKYIKIADCVWHQAGTLQVYLDGNSFVDTLVINFGGGNAVTPMLCGYYSGNSNGVSSVIAQNGSIYHSDYSIYVKIRQRTDCSVHVALLKGSCTINITESTTAPTNISEWPVDYGLFGNITSPNITGWSNGSACAICSTDASVQDKVINLPGLTLTTGTTVNVFFSNGNSAEHPRLKVNSNDAMPIYTNQQGNLNFIVKDWDAGISMTLMFKGDSFVVLGNPIVELKLNLVTAGSSAERNFIRYASGLLIQWGTVIVNGLTQQPIEAYTSSSSYSLLATPSDGAIGWTDCRRYAKETIKLAIKSTNTGYTDGTVSWLTIGW